MKFLTSLFPLDDVNVPSPKAPPGLEQPIYDVLGYVRWGAIVVLVGLLFVQAGRLASAKREWNLSLLKDSFTGLQAQSSSVLLHRLRGCS